MTAGLWPFSIQNCQVANHFRGVNNFVGTIVVTMDYYSQIKHMLIRDL